MIDEQWARQLAWGRGCDGLKKWMGRSVDADAPGLWKTGSDPPLRSLLSR
jgi:hypothetical protein